MAEQQKTPNYMTQLLDALGWNQGTRIPLANPDNQNLETLLIDRQNEIQTLKEAVALQNQKCADLDKYSKQVETESQENTRLLLAHKQQLEQEVKLRQLSNNEADSFNRDAISAQKQIKGIATRIDNFQANIARLLKKADSLKTEVCGERGALQEWRAQLERNSGDITAIEQFTKQDISKAKALDIQRQKLKVEHDHMLDRLNLLVSNLTSEERACERISYQVIEGMEQRRQIMLMWAAVVENLRQRDTDIRHIREDYEVLELEANKTTDLCREQQGFCDQQAKNNAEATRNLMALMQQLSNLRMQHQAMLELNATLDSDVHCLQRELQNMRRQLEKLHMENRRIMDEQHRRDTALKAIINKIKDLKEKLTESLDQTKSSEQRAKELENILQDEERYASNLTVNQQHGMHCSFVEQQNFLALKNEEKLFNMQLRASTAVMNKLDKKQGDVLKNLQNIKESLYGICYQVETIGSQVLRMEGEQAERESSAELMAVENRLLEVRGRHAARVALLERHSAKLADDMRRLTRDLDQCINKHAVLQSRLKASLLNAEGSEKDLRNTRAEWRNRRVYEALIRMRVAHSMRALDALNNRAYSADKQRLQLEAAMCERLVEIEARRDMFNVQVRGLTADCGKLRGDIKERENRIDQLKKRYDIFIASLGKDDSGQQLSMTFFKIKFAAERAELRERGSALDADIGRQERDISALEATLRVVHAAHAHFMHHITPLSDDTPEMLELDALMKKYYQMRDELKEVDATCAELEQRMQDASSRVAILNDKSQQLSMRHFACQSQLDQLRDRVSKQESRLQNALDIVKNNAKRAKKFFENVDDWRIFQLSMWVRDYSEAATNALGTLVAACESPATVHAHFAALMVSSDMQRYLTHQQRQLRFLIQRVLEEEQQNRISANIEESVFSTPVSSEKSGVSMASGFTKRLTAFRKTLSTKVQEKALVDDIRAQALRSSVSLRVVTVGLNAGEAMVTGSTTNYTQLKKPPR